MGGNLRKASCVVFCLKQKLVDSFTQARKSTHCSKQAMWTEVPRRAPGAKFKPKLPGLFWLKSKSPWAKQLETKSMAHGWSPSEGKLCSVLSEAKTRGTLCRKSEKHALFGTSSLDRSAKMITWHKSSQNFF